MQDLSGASCSDPVYSLVPGLARELVEEEEGSYARVAQYLAKEEKLASLQEKVGHGFEALVSSQQELKKVTGEVQEQLGSLREARGRLGVDREARGPVTGEQGEKEGQQDLC